MRPVVPPVVLVGAALGAQRRVGERRPCLARTLAAGVLVGASGALGVAASRSFARARTTVDPVRVERAVSLVTDGAHGLSRNPMYVAMVGLLSAHALHRGRPAAALPAVAFWAVMNHVQIPAEEAALRDNFGAGYDDYRARVPRWL